MKYRHREGYKIVKKRENQKGVYTSMIIGEDSVSYKMVIYLIDAWTDEPKKGEPLTIFEKYEDIGKFFENTFTPLLRGEDVFLFIAEYIPLYNSKYEPWHGKFGGCWPQGTILCKSIRLIKEIT